MGRLKIREGNKVEEEGIVFGLKPNFMLWIRDNEYRLPLANVGIRWGPSGEIVSSCDL